MLDTWVSRSAMWITLTPSAAPSAAHCSRVVGVAAACPVSLAMLSIACLTKCDTSPGLAPWVITAVGPVGWAARSLSALSRSA
jgi:hypothetical protein